MTGTVLMGGAEGGAGATPTAFGKYRVLGKLGGGGFGTVWRCADDALGREVAVKALSAAAVADPELRERFLLEARALAKVGHPAVVQVYDVGETETGPFFVMELVEGKDLERMVRETGPLPEARALALVREAVQGLAAAAKAGVVHRDIKPANLMVTGAPPRESVKVTDFGLAFPTQGGRDRLTAPTTILGTPEYMAPEQARGQSVDARADMYAMGCTLYELLVGTPPFTGATPQEVVTAHFTRTPEPPRVRRPDLTVATNNLVLRLMAREPEGRFPTHDDVLVALDGALGASPAAPGAARVSASGLVPPPPAPASGSTAQLDRALKTENLALCFVDLLDFQERTQQQTRDENTEWVGAFGDGMKRLIRQRGGRFIKQAYGTVLCTFGSPTDAVLFGMAAVDAAWAWSRGKPPIMSWQLRVGINLGEVRLDRGDVFGDPVNVAARVMAKAEPGQVWFGDAVYLAMNRSEVPAEGVGSHELKGVPVPVRLFRALPMPGVASAGGPPFGVKERSGGEALEGLDKGARAVVDGVGRGARELTARANPLLARAAAGAAVLWARVPPPHRVKVAVGVPTLLGALVLGLVIPRALDPYRKEKDLLDDGKPAAAARLLETRVAEEPRAQWWYGKALLQSGRKLEGLEQWEEALGRDGKLADDETLEGILAAMDMKDRLPRRLVVKHWGARARDALKDRTTSERFHVRHHAAQALKELELAPDVDWVGVYLKDVRLETECVRRQQAVRGLEELGDTRALSALSAARADPGGDPGCVTEMLGAAERRLKKKLGTP
ncbi:MAG: protein kinase [Deltaproteobacteria bacterium]|nr:protein kinase [Deltaproteobacteria bacterium]